jgi:hypothetical protein
MQCVRGGASVLGPVRADDQRPASGHCLLPAALPGLLLPVPGDRSSEHDQARAGKDRRDDPRKRRRGDRRAPRDALRDILHQGKILQKEQRGETLGALRDGRVGQRQPRVRGRCSVMMIRIGKNRHIFPSNNFLSPLPPTPLYFLFYFKNELGKYNFNFSFFI